MKKTKEDDERNLIKGTFQGTEKGFGFVMPERATDKDKNQEIFIERSKTMAALNGDKVIVRIIKGPGVVNGEERKAEGEVIQIIDHAKNVVVGLFQKSKNYGFVVPDDKKLGSDIFVSKKDIGKARNNDKVMVQITKYPINSKGVHKSAEGKIIEVLGNVNEAGVDILSIVRDYSIKTEFSPKAAREAKEMPQEVTEKDLIGRKDFRGENIFTIDGDDSKDFDDAVQVKKLDNGNYYLGVHIADVSHYVKEDSPLDKEAFKRGTSIYMLDRVIPMLPFELSNGICSLNEGVDRLTLSVEMEIDINGGVISSDISKGVIRNKKRMTYNGVYKILEGDLEDQSMTPYIYDIKQMEELAKILKERRLKNGYLNLDIPESKIVLDNKGHCIDVKKYEQTFANEIIEQFMLTANEVIAERFYWLEAPFIYRNHDIPDEDKVRELNDILSPMGYTIKGSKENIHPKAFAQIIDNAKGKPEERVVSTLVLRTLRVARYEADNMGHFGIASKYYCHFTSPIRRYPDLFIHRIISHYIEKGYNVDEEYQIQERARALDAAEQSSDQERIAQEAERDSVSIKMAEFMQDKIGEEYEGVVSSITSFGMFVELPNTVEGLVRFESMGGDYFEFDGLKREIIGRNTGQRYKIGDQVNIRVIDANKQLRRIDFELADYTLTEEELEYEDNF